jgi:hypothetical protein
MNRYIAKDLVEEYEYVVLREGYEESVKLHQRAKKETRKAVNIADERLIGYNIERKWERLLDILERDTTKIDEGRWGFRLFVQDKYRESEVERKLISRKLNKIHRHTWDIGEVEETGPFLMRKGKSIATLTIVCREYGLYLGSY